MAAFQSTAQNKASVRAREGTSARRPEFRRAKISATFLNGTFTEIFNVTATFIYLLILSTLIEGHNREDNTITYIKNVQGT